MLGDIESDSFWRGFEPGSIDAVVSFETLEHCHNPKKILSNFYRILKYHGMLLLSTPNGLNERKNAEGKPHHTFHVNSYPASDLYIMVSNAGFNAIKLYGQCQLYGYLMRYLRKMLNTIEKDQMYYENKFHDDIKITRSRMYTGLTGLRDWFIEVTGLIGHFSKPTTRLVTTADTIIIHALK